MCNVRLSKSKYGKCSIKQCFKTNERVCCNVRISLYFYYVLFCASVDSLIFQARLQYQFCGLRLLRRVAGAMMVPTSNSYGKRNCLFG